MITMNLILTTLPNTSINVMPTFSHPTGKRAHLMNVYTNKKYQRQGIAKQMVSLLIDDAKEKHVTEISLDATDEGRLKLEMDLQVITLQDMPVKRPWNKPMDLCRESS